MALVGSGRIPGMCEDDVVARVVLVAATGRGGAGETEFENHVGGDVGVIGVWYLYAMQWLWISPTRWPTPTICGDGGLSRGSGLGSGRSDRVSGTRPGEVRKL